MVALADWLVSPIFPSIGELSTPLAGLFSQLQSLWLVNMILWFSLGLDDFRRIKDINAEHESYFRLYLDTGLVYSMQGSRDLVWKTTLDISLNIRLISHQDGGSFRQILFQTTWILYADSIYQSKYYLEVSVDIFADPSRLLPWCQSTSPILEQR